MPGPGAGHRGRTAAAARAARGEPAGKLREKSPAWRRRVAVQGRRSQLPPAVAGTTTRRWGGQELCAGHLRDREAGPCLPPAGASKSPRAAPALLHIRDRWPRCLLLDASTDDELTTSQGSLFICQARHLIHLSWVPHLDGSRPVSSHKHNVHSNPGEIRRPPF